MDRVVDWWIHGDVDWELYRRKAHQLGPLVAGMLFAARWFDGDHADEAEIRRLEKLTAPVGPRSAWIPHDGRGMPAYADTQQVEVRFVNGEMACGRVESYGWVWVQGNLWNIAEYRLLG